MVFQTIKKLPFRVASVSFLGLCLGDTYTRSPIRPRKLPLGSWRIKPEIYSALAATSRVSPVCLTCQFLFAEQFMSVSSCYAFCNLSENYTVLCKPCQPLHLYLWKISSFCSKRGFLPVLVKSCNPSILFTFCKPPDLQNLPNCLNLFVLTVGLL